MQIEITVNRAHPCTIDRHDVERLFELTLGQFDELLAATTIVLDAHRDAEDEWPRCTVRTVDRAGVSRQFDGADPDAYACVRSTLRRAERATRRHARRPGLVAIAGAA